MVQVHQQSPSSTFTSVPESNMHPVKLANEITIRSIYSYNGGSITIQLTRPQEVAWGFTVRRMFFCETKVKVKRVHRGSPAEAAGLMADDRIIAVDGVAVEYLLADSLVAETFKTKTAMTLTVLPSVLHRLHGAAMDNNERSTLVLKRCKQIKSWGFTLRWCNEVQGFIVIRTRFGFPAHCANILVGDKIITINGQPLDDAAAVLSGQPLKLESPEIEMRVEVERRVHWANATPVTLVSCSPPSYTTATAPNTQLPPPPMTPPEMYPVSALPQPTPPHPNAPLYNDVVMYNPTHNGTPRESPTAPTYVDENY
eukprot:m.199261 g.199261  ORF g.199261 m.199261 type:complete len:312 (-) comp32727_c0_seq1:294-1229(-)